MAISELPDRLSRMTTRCPLVREAHTPAGEQAGPARQVLTEQYGGAACRYVLGAVRDPDVADELLQEFAVRLLGGDFHRACPERGRGNGPRHSAPSLR